MRELTGRGVGRGSTVGPVARMGAPLAEPPRAASSRMPSEELTDARAALHAVAIELRHRAADAQRPAVAVLQARAAMAEDHRLLDAVQAATERGLSAARAVYEAFEIYGGDLAGGGEYAADRAADLADVRQRAVAACLGLPAPGVPDVRHAHVLVARDLSPAEVGLLDLGRVLGLVTEEGGPTSHAAILARARGIPAVVACAGATTLADNEIVVVDARRNAVVVDPPPDQVAATRMRSSAPWHQGGPGRTKDGQPIPLQANIGGPEDLEAAHAAGAEGVGLFRTESLFSEVTEPPSAEQQEEVYTQVLSAFAGQRVVVRVLDSRADEPLRSLRRDPGALEPNPALGMRGVRVLRAHRDLLATQLTALARAAKATGADLGVMAPMVSDVEDASWFVDEARQAGLASPGVMIEVPSAALTAGNLLRVASFASVGTNDLTQYTLAADRRVGALASLQDPWHPAVLRLIELVGASGSLAGKPVGVCGEAAADPLLACILVGLGANSLSMVPAAIADVREELARHTFTDCLRMAELALRAPTAAEAHRRVTAAAG